ncbi:T9SS type A sorting domain-containing protein [Flavitalea antarctica]
MKRLLMLLPVLLSAYIIRAQVNGYANVTSIAGPVLSISSPIETHDVFNIGDRVMVMQMQDNVIGSNTGNNSNFGDLANISNTGRYEFATIALVARVGGIVNLITLTGSLNSSFTTGANSSVQIITFPTLGSNFSTNADIVAVPWNGVVGGVVAFNVNGTLTLRHNILADNAGFRGGATDVSSANYGTCNSTTYYNAVDPWFGNKGEGIYKNTNPAFAAGKGKMINGGGGANTINSGGGGGANFTAGGTGAIGWSCSSATGGVGGASLSVSLSLGKVFLGGGGGSGEGNDNSNNKGGNGGGFIYIAADQVRTTGSGATLRISANGEDGNPVGNDGAGGGGAGGTIAFQVNNWNIGNNKHLAITTNGGDGGNVNNGGAHGGGAGGGQGAILFSGQLPTSNTTVNSLNGTGGENWIGGTRAPGGAGTNNSGIITSAFIVLPLNLISFTAGNLAEGTQLKWTTENGETLSHFDVQVSTDGRDFRNIGTIASKNNASSAQAYGFFNPGLTTKTMYYRLKLVDNDGSFTYSKIITVKQAGIPALMVNIYPNPARSNPVVNIRSSEKGQANVSVLNMQGSVLSSEIHKLNTGDNAVVLESVNKLPAAVYNVHVLVNGQSIFTRLIIQK